MAIIQITPELLTAKAAEVRRLRSSHDDVMAQMKTLVHGLNDQWKGDAQNAFVAKFDSMQASFTSFSEMLEGYASLMDTASREMSATDASLKGTINSFG